MQLLPQDCQARLQCAACQEFFTKTEWTANQLRRKKLVCKTCMAKHKHGSTKLECIQCRTESTTREEALHAKFKKSEQYCTCGKHIHSEIRCIFTAEEIIFLSQLNPRPKWWVHAMCTCNRHKYRQ